MTMPRFAAALVLAAFALAPARAQTAGEVLRSMELDGAWFMYCDKDIGSMTVSIPAAGDPVVISRSPVSELTSRITAAERLAGNTVRLLNEITNAVFKGPPNPKIRIGDKGEGVWEKTGDGIRLQQARLGDFVTVRDGRYVFGGPPTPVMRRCPNS
jgi:hypothetical protein